MRSLAHYGAGRQGLGSVNARRTRQAHPARPHALDGRAQQAFGSGGLRFGQHDQLQQQQQQQQQQQEGLEQQLPPQPQPPQGAAPPADTRAAAASPEPPAPTPAAPAPVPAPAPERSAREEWDAWCEFFEEMDRKGNELDRVTLELQAAVRAERYADAARLQPRAAALAAADAAAAARAALAGALAREDYAAAAALRDNACAWMEGWWLGKAQGDSVGHLMRVTPEYGRWTGKIYSARDLAEAMGWYDAGGGGVAPGPGAAGALAWRAAGSGAGGRGGGRVDAAALEEAGSPLLEVFLRSAVSEVEGASQAGAAALQSQPVCLWPQAGGGALGGSGGADAAARALLSSLGGGGAAGGGRVRGMEAALIDDVISGGMLVVEEQKQQQQQRGAGDVPGGGGGCDDAVLTVYVDEDGIATITAVRSDGDDEDAARDLSRAWQQLGDSAAAREGRPLGGQQQGWEDGRRRLGSASSCEGDDAEAALRELWGEVPSEEQQQQQQQQQQQHHHGAPWEPSGGETVPASWGFVAGGAAARQAAARSAAAPLPARAPAPPGQRRCPADVVPIGRDRFVLLPRDPPAAAAAAVAAAEAAPPRPPSPTPYDPRNRPPGAASPDGLASFAHIPAGCGADPAAVDASVDGADEDEMWGRVTEEVARIQEERSGVAVPRRALADAIRGAAQRLAAEGRLPAGAAPRVRVVPSGAAAAPAPPVFLSPAPPVAAVAPPRAAAAARPPQLSSPLAAPLAAHAAGDVAAAAGPWASPPMITYSRLHISRGSLASDPLSGLFIGSFGAHGPELLQLIRGVDDDGDECVTGYKVTGDENVPCGQVSFRAKVGRRHRLDTKAHYPEDMGVSARYAGEGRIADSNYSNAKWVEGELLVFSSASNEMITGGARVGFVWSVPNDRRFLILLNRIQLE